MRQVGGTQKTINKFQWDLSMQQVVLIWPCMCFPLLCRGMPALYIYINIITYIYIYYNLYIYIQDWIFRICICTYMYIYICACIYKIVFKPWFLKYVLSEGSWHWHVAPRPVCTGWDCCLLHTEVSAKCRMQLAQLGLAQLSEFLVGAAGQRVLLMGLAISCDIAPRTLDQGYIYIYIHILLVH